jgi:arylsulfatase A-like enzyme
LLLAVWFSLLTGLAQLCVLGVKKSLGQVINHSAEVAWMAPLADLLAFVPFALLLSLAAWLRPRLVSVRVATFLFAFLFFAALALSFQGLAAFAAPLLAAGLAVETSRQVASRADAFLRFVRRSLVVLAGLSIAAGVCVPIWQRWSDARQTPEAQDPAAADAPNVLLVTLDTVRAHNLSVYGYPRRTTPNLERLAANGSCFDRAVAPAPWTLPSHASMFTGRFPHELSVSWDRPLANTHPTLAEALAREGYTTAGFVANNYCCQREFGLSRGFAHYEDYPLTIGQLLLSSDLTRVVANQSRVRSLAHRLGFLHPYDSWNRKTAATITSDFLSWLSHQDRRPFFAFLNYIDAHTPYLPPPPFDEEFGPKRPPVDPSQPSYEEMMDRRKLSQREIQTELDAYDGAIAHIDDQLNVLFEGLQGQDRLQNTLVIITSDHGELFGEHGLFCHGNSLYWPLLNVPLIISWPNHVPAGKRVALPVSLRDLPATIVDLLDLGERVQFPGASLSRCWDNTARARALEPLLTEMGPGPGGECVCPGCGGRGMMLAEVEPGVTVPVRDWYPNAKEAMQSLILGTKHYIRVASGREELYDIETDPLEQHNLIGSADAKPILEQFRSCLGRLRAGE